MYLIDFIYNQRVFFLSKVLTESRMNLKLRSDVNIDRNYDN